MDNSKLSYKVRKKLDELVYQYNADAQYEDLRDEIYNELIDLFIEHELTQEQQLYYLIQLRRS